MKPETKCVSITSIYITQPCPTDNCNAVSLSDAMLQCQMSITEDNNDVNKMEIGHFGHRSLTLNSFNIELEKLIQFCQSASLKVTLKSKG